MPGPAPARTPPTAPKEAVEIDNPRFSDLNYRTPDPGELNALVHIPLVLAA
jgi:hypothetical protein